MGANALKAVHVGHGAQLKIKNGGLLNLCQFYAIVRCRLAGERSHVGKMLLLARIMDCLEHDYSDCYGSDGEPFPGGCEEIVKMFIEGWRQHEAEK